jgi:hypothetical protein
MSLSHLPFQSPVPGSAPPETRAPSIRFSRIRGAESGGSIGLLLAGELDLEGSTRTSMRPIPGATR